jgi:transposase-like protein
MLGRKEVDTMAGRRSGITPKVKFRVVLEVLTGERTPGQVARVYGVHANSVGLWKKLFLERGPQIFERESGVSESDRRIAELERLLGKKEVEIALLKNFLGRVR